jgi:hypothetical protein
MSGIIAALADPNTVQAIVYELKELHHQIDYLSKDVETDRLLLTISSSVLLAIGLAGIVALFRYTQAIIRRRVNALVGRADILCL